jgi:phage terminase large subunit GpA-like protein
MGPIESGISADLISQRLSGYPRYIIPPDCTLLTQGIDVQKRGLHWVVKAWRADATNYVIDYSFLDSKVSSYEDRDEGIELAIYRTILARMDQLRESPYHTLDGEIAPVGLTLVDSGWMTNAVYSACQKIGLGIYPAKGAGKSKGCCGSMFSPALKASQTCKPGDRISWRLDRQDKGVWLVNCSADHWKAFEHARWLTPEGKPGAAYLFGEIGDDEINNLRRKPRQAKEHFEFSKHLTAEIEVEDVVRGVMKRFWKMKTGREANHYLDASYLSDVGASMLGIRLVGERPADSPPPAQRPTAAQLAARK